MKIGLRTSSDSFADFTLSRISKDVRDSLTDEQYREIRRALTARDERARHRIDIRLRIPLFLRSYYFVFFAGRDRAASTYWLENARRSCIPLPLRIVIHYLFSTIILLTVFIIAFMTMYHIKRLLGIDIFQGFHLSDIWASLSSTAIVESIDWRIS